MSSEYPSGKTTVAPDVVLTIARMAALGIEGVSSFAPVISGVDGIFRRGITDGVRVQVENGLVYLDLFLILKHDVNVREVSRNVQHQVARSISETLGMEVGHVHIHIENIDYSGEASH